MLKNKPTKRNCKTELLYSTVVKSFSRELYLISLGKPLKVVMQTRLGYGKIWVPLITSTHWGHSQTVFSSS